MYPPTCGFPVEGSTGLRLCTLQGWSSLRREGPRTIQLFVREHEVWWKSEHETSPDPTVLHDPSTFPVSIASPLRPPSEIK